LCVGVGACSTGVGIGKRDVENWLKGKRGETRYISYLVNEIMYKLWYSSGRLTRAWQRKGDGQWGTGSIRKEKRVKRKKSKNKVGVGRGTEGGGKFKVIGFAPPIGKRAIKRERARKEDPRERANS